MRKTWLEASLGDVIEETKPGFASGYDLDEGVFQFRMNNLTREGDLDLTKRRRVPPDTKNLDTFLLRPGDVLFNATNSPDLVGKSAYLAELDEPAVFSNHFLRLRADTARLEPKFLWRFLQLQWHRGFFRSRARQWVNQATYGREALIKLHLPLPPLDQQRKIAELLEQADELRAKRLVSLALLDSLDESIFLDMFGDPVSNERGWPLVAFSEVCPTRLGKMLDQKQQTGMHLRRYLRNANVRWFDFDLADVAEMDFNSTDRVEFRVVAGDLLICEGGEPGRAAIWEGQIEEIYFQKALHRGRPISSRAKGVYLVHLLRYLARRGGLVEHISSATIAHLTGARLKTMRVPVPDLTLQLEFETRVHEVGASRRSLILSGHALTRLFFSVQHLAFAGEL